MNTEDMKKWLKDLEEREKMQIQIVLNQAGSKSNYAIQGRIYLGELQGQMYVLRRLLSDEGE